MLPSTSDSLGSRGNRLRRTSSAATRVNSAKPRECRRRCPGGSAKVREESTKRGMSELIALTQRERSQRHREIGHGETPCFPNCRSWFGAGCAQKRAATALL